ncbi:hypothetical protein [Parafrigoribacterium humi]|uniref:hypothetical protein n=1 Tax=Parafrigoribacterium humi TaxID=3144664 RepID=UPI0032EEC09F
MGTAKMFGAASRMSTRQLHDDQERIANFAGPLFELVSPHSGLTFSGFTWQGRDDRDIRASLVYGSNEGPHAAEVTTWLEPWKVDNPAGLDTLDVASLEFLANHAPSLRPSVDPADHDRFVAAVQSLPKQARSLRVAGRSVPALYVQHGELTVLLLAVGEVEVTLGINFELPDDLELTVKLVDI